MASKARAGLKILSGCPGDARETGFGVFGLRLRCSGRVARSNGVTLLGELG